MPCQSHRPTTKMDDVPTDPEGCNSEAKSVEGVDGKDSVWSSIGPPASSPKRSNQKGEEILPPNEKSRRNVSDLSDQNSEVKAASSPLVQGPVNQSLDQDSWARDDSSISI